MTTDAFPSYTQAEQAEAQENLERRPDWAKEQYDITDIKGVVEDITTTTREASGYIFEDFRLQIRPTGEVKRGNFQRTDTYITVAKPVAGSKKGTRQPYYWTIAGAKALDASIDNIGDMKGKEWHFVLGQRKPWPTADRADFFYDVTEKGSGSGNGSTVAAVTDPATRQRAVDTVVAFAIGKTDEEIKATVFPYLQQEKVNFAPIQLEIHNGKVLDEAVAAGRLAQDGEGKYQAGPAFV